MRGRSDIGMSPRSRSRSVDVALLTTLGLAAWLAACGADAPSVQLGGGCNLASDCVAPNICAFQLCHQQCDSDRDCPSDARCVRSEANGNVCQLPTERDCERTSDCPAGQVCAVDQQCRNACRDAKDCTPGEVCADGTCAKPGEVAHGGKLPQKGGSDGAPCRYDSECQVPRLCVNHQCVFRCVTDVDCPLEQRCVANDCEPIEPVCVPGQQTFCEPCGVKVCNEDGIWNGCSQDGCGGSGPGGSGPGTGGSGPGSGGNGPGSGGASTTSGPTSTASGAVTSGSTGTTTSSSTSAVTTATSGGATASSSVVTVTSGAAGAGPSSGTTCVQCIDAGISGEGGAHPRNFCCQ